MQLRKEIKFETLHKSHKKGIIIGVVTICIIGSILVFKTTRAKYRFTQSIPFVRGVINYKMPDLNVIAMYQENSAGNGWDSIDVAPTSGYILNTTESKCEVNGAKDSSISIDFLNGKLSVSNFSKKGTKCYVYFDKLRGDTPSTILAKYTKSGVRSNYQTLTSDNSGKVFSLEDDDGTSYYFAGRVNNNWVKFANIYWRIIRFNGDGTMRLIYSGTTTTTTGTGTQIDKSKFNSIAGNNKYVGYRYTDGQVHGKETSSTIQGVIDDWYKISIVDKGYSGKVDNNAGFCGDREPSDGSGGTGTITTNYGAYIRLKRTYPAPTFKCKNSSDLYTITGATKGNNSLTYPVGLISADEVNAAGAEEYTNSSYYLYTGQDYWTMSPANYSNQDYSAYVYYVNDAGNLAYITYVSINGGSRNGGVSEPNGVRPVLNLRADTTFKSGGDGTSTSPYEVE